MPERAIVAALMPGAPFRAFNGYRLVFSIVPLPFRQLTATIVSSSAKAKKMESEQGNKIIWNRLKSYIEYIVNLGGSPVGKFVFLADETFANEKKPPPMKH